MEVHALRRTRQLIIACVLGLAALVVLAKAYGVWTAREAAIAHAERDAMNATTTLAELAARTFDGVSRALDGALEIHANVADGRIRDPGAIHEALRTIHGGSPVILGIGWTDAAGNRVASSVYRDPPPLNIADQPQFAIHRESSASGIHIAAPLRSRVDGTWIIPVSRRIDDGEGRFAGIVNAVLRLDYFLDVYRAINLGADAVIALIRHDAVLLARVPMVPELMGQTQPWAVAVGERLPAEKGAVTTRAVSRIDGRERIFGYEKIAGFPLAITAGMSTAEALAPYRKALLAAIVEGASMIGALAVAGGLLLLAIRRRIADARALSRTSALLQSVFAASNQAIIVFDRERRAVAWNELCVDYFGDALKLGVGAPLHAMLQRLAAEGELGLGDVDAEIAERLAVAHAGEPVRYERKRPNGTVVEVSWLPLPDGFLAISHTDITRLKQTEKALRENEAKAAQALARLNDAVESLADPFLLWDADERLVLVNSATAKDPGGEVLTPGVRLEEALRQHVRAGRFPAAAGREEDYVRERLAHIRRADGEPMEVRHADGRWLAAWDRRTQEGGIVSLRVDITRLKQAEVAVRESEARTLQAHARLNDAIESLRDIFMLWDADERLVLFNSAAIPPLSLGAPVDREALKIGVRLEDAVTRFVRAGRVPEAIGREAEYVRERLEQIRRGDGAPVEVRLADGRWLAMVDRRTREGGIVSLRVDITEMKAREAELAEARREADRASDAKSDFMSRMSHELRTPLNAVIGFSQMLQIDRAGGMTDRQRNYYVDIETAGRHLLALVNDMLDLARIESGNDRLSIERVSAADVLASARSAMAALAAKDGIDLRFADAAGVPDIRADDMRLHQVLLNFVSNAIKYNRKGGSVEVTAGAVAGGRVRFAVADTGIGIEKARQKDLFEPFRRIGQEYSGIDGTGIGLAICKRLAHAMDGSVGFTSTARVGSTFWIDLPVDRSTEKAAAAAETRRMPMLDAYPAGFSILYVEDNPANMRLMEHLVSILRGVALLTASNARLGLDLAYAHRPDIILLDLHLPGMNGYEMLAHLRAMPETAGIPVIALTAAAMPNDVRRGLAAGFFRYLTKPIDVNEFIEVIGECIPLARDGDGQQAV